MSGRQAGELRVGDRVTVPGVVVELRTVAGVSGALVDVGGKRTPLWLPRSVLVVTRERRGSGGEPAGG